MDLEGVKGMLETARRVHFVGIGGVGMSALAELLNHRGYTVSGSDRERSDLTDRATTLGIEVHIGHNADYASNAEAVVYTPAIDEDNPELAEAKRRGLLVIKRAELLGEVTQGQRLVAVAGTHGKTTTTAMVTSICEAAGAAPTALIGGTLSDGRNLLIGGDDVWVVEADEYDRSFLTLKPVVAVVTSLEPDHLDCYDGVNDLVSTFDEFLNRLPGDGTAVICRDQEAGRQIQVETRATVVNYGLNDGDLHASDVRVEGYTSAFDVVLGEETLGGVRLRVPGSHNVTNALGAIGAATALEIDWPSIAEGLDRFCGVGRRFEVLLDRDDVTVVSDYAHHPTEVICTIEAARAGAKGRVVAVFQPHLYSRTRDFADKFSQALSKADFVWVTDIYPARETPIPGITSRTVVDGVSVSVNYEPSLETLPGRVADTTEAGDTILVMGAGDVVTVAYALAKHLADGLGDR